MLRSFHSLAMTDKHPLFLMAHRNRTEIYLKHLSNAFFRNSFLLSYFHKPTTILKANSTTVVYTAAPRSSSITPQPPGKSSNFLRGGGFMISKILNNTNVMASGNILCGVKYKGINKQAYSSITIWCGSLPQIFVRSFEIAIPSATSPMVNAT